MNTRTGLWIEALRSGAYSQTRHRLRQRSRLFWRPAAFCALGVLYDVYLKEHGERWPEKLPNGQLPREVLDWAAIPRALECEVVAHNDRGRSFAEIASIIEAYFHRADRDRLWRESGRIANRSIRRAREAGLPVA